MRALEKSRVVHGLPLFPSNLMSMNSYWVRVPRFAKEQVNVTREFTHLSKHRRLRIHNSVSGLKCNFLSLFSGSAPPSNTRAAGSSLNNTVSLASQLPFERFGRAPLRSAPHRPPSPGSSLLVWVSRESPHSLAQLRMLLHSLDPFCLPAFNWFPGSPRSVASPEVKVWVRTKMVGSVKRLADSKQID